MKMMEPETMERSMLYQIEDNVSYFYADDMDNDGDFDLVCASLASDKIAWYKNDGTGNFVEKQIISTLADGPKSVFSADLNGDRNTDVLSASYLDNKIAWYENDGIGNFSAQQIITTNTVSASDVFAADLDGDGYIDALSASSIDDKIAWYKNYGEGNFVEHIINFSFTASSPSCVFAADLDGDGDLDVLSSSYEDSKIAWYENNGMGKFSSQQIITTTYGRKLCLCRRFGWRWRLRCFVGFFV